MATAVNTKMKRPTNLIRTGAGSVTWGRFSLWFALARFGLRSSFLIPPGLAFGLEVGFIPTSPLEAERGGRDKFLHAGFAALGTRLDWGVADLLNNLKAVTAVRTLVFVNRHGTFP